MDPLYRQRQPLSDSPEMAVPEPMALSIGMKCEPERLEGAWFGVANRDCGAPTGSTVRAQHSAQGQSQATLLARRHLPDGVRSG